MGRCLQGDFQFYILIPILPDQAVELIKDSENPHLFYYKGYLAYNWRGDERGNIKFLTSRGWDNGYHPNTPDNQLLTGTTPMRQGGDDTKWFIPEDRSGDGYYEITLNTLDMNLTVDVFRHDLHPGRIYAVGGAMPCGWNNNNPEIMERVNPLEAVYTWTGIMNSGDFKFLTPLSIGNWDFGYCATTPNEAVNYGVAQNLVFEVRHSNLTPFDDQKFIMSETAECTITVDLENMTMTVTKGGEPVAQDIWIFGSAIPGGKAKLVSGNIDPLINYHYYGELLVGDFKFSTTEEIGATTEFYVPVSASNAISNTDITLSSDENAAGWTVTEANDMYKVKLNVLTNKYKGSIFNVQHVYIVGGATAIGWDAGNAIELTRGTGDEVNIFTFDGNLVINADGPDRNKFKFLLQRDWGPSSFHAQTENESIIGSLYFTDRVSDDYKWIVDEDKQGRYVIKLDALEETLDVTYYPEISTNIDYAQNHTKVFASDGKITVKSDTESIKTVEVYMLDGRRIVNKGFTSNIEMEISKGIYIIKIMDENSHIISRKVSVF